VPACPAQLPLTAPAAVAAPARSAVAAVAGALTLAVALATVSGCTSPVPVSVTSVASLPSDGWHGVSLPEPYAKPSLVLLDMNGRTFRIDRDTNRAVVLVTFGFTHCRTVCADVLSAVADAVRPLDPGTRSRIELLFVTVDPSRDDARSLRAYLSRFDPTFLGLTGSPWKVRELGEELGVPVTSPQLLAGDYDVPHGAQVIGFGSDGLAHLIWMPGTRTADLRADLVRLASFS
jgi:protein SCO1